MKLYNTLTRKKETLEPIKKNRVGFYSCGPTVYNYAHIGNLRTYIFTDVLSRSLEFTGHKVKHVMNITDVGHLTSDADQGEDKLEKGAKREGKTVWEIAKFYEKEFFKDANNLNIKKPSKVVRATDTIKDQIKLIEQIVKNGYSYETEKALYFDVSKFKNYGKLSGQSLEEKLSCSRDEVVEDKEKKNCADFALWMKRVGKHKNHVMHWPSSWGDGFPGWHIECSAISAKYLGQPFDIHSGGEDHIGTHHENEIAQSKAGTGKDLANIWIHTRHLVLEKGKMAKSTGDFITLQTVIDKGFDPLVYRYLCLTAHYRSPLKFSWDNLEQARNAYENLIELIVNIEKEKPNQDEVSDYEQQFCDYISDDIDMPQALAVVWDLVKDSEFSSKRKLEIIKDFDKVLGLDLIAQAHKLSKEQATIPKEIKKLADERWEYRNAKEFDKADDIRLKLANKGYEIEDKDNEFIIKKIRK